MIKARIFVPVVLAVLLAGFGSYIFPGRVEVSDLQEIAFVKMGAAVEVSVSIRGEFSHDVFKLTKPERLVFDVFPIDTISAAPQMDIDFGGVLRARTGKFKTRMARLVFDLETDAVNYSIVRTNDGMKVTFWKEGEKTPLPGEKAEIPPASKPIEARPEITLEAESETPPEAKQEDKSEVKPEPKIESALLSGGDEKKFFVQIGGGAGMFLKSTATFHRSFPFFSKQGERTETYELKLNTPSSLSIGAYFKDLAGPVKLGLDVEYWNFKSDGAFEFTLPHPFLSNSPRTLTMANKFRSYLTSVSAFGLFQIFAKSRLTMFAGPEVGIAFGKYKFLDNVEFNDQPPFFDDDVTITSVTYLKKSISNLWVGVQAAFEYSLSRSFSLLLNLRTFYLNPEIKEMSSTFSLSQTHALIGFQYNF